MNTTRLALGVIFLLSLAAATAAADPPSENVEPTSPPRVSPAEEEAAARAFADARDNTPVEWWNLEPFPWPRIATDARTAARRLAETHREAMVSVVNKRLGRGTFSFHLLTLMILEELRMPDKAVELAVSSSKRGTAVGVLLAVSHCSQSVREAVVNGLLTNWLDERGFPESEGVFLIEFAAVVGNAETAELLKKHIQKIMEKHGGKKTPPQPPLGWKAARERPHRWHLNSFKQAADRIERRLALSEDAKRQRSEDELLFWQTTVNVPNLASCNGEWYSARAVAASKLRVSPDYLIEVLGRVKNKERPSLEWETAVELVVAQKENAAVGALVEFVKRDPRYRQKIEKALREMGTPEAEKGLQEIDAYCW